MSSDLRSSVRFLRGGGSRDRWVLPATAAALVAGCLVWRAWLLQVRTFDPDEMQHLHVAWSVSHGLVPYRDFFEHHAPGLALLLAPFVGAFDTARSFEAVQQTMVLSRAVMLLFCGLAIGATWKLAELAFGRSAAWVAAVLLSLSIVFIGRSTEIRPDVPALACWTASLAALGFAARSARPSAALRCWFLSGLLLGLAVVFTQKLLLAGPGLAAASVLYVAASCWPAEARTAVRQVITMFGGFLLPPGAVAVYFAWRGALWPMATGTLFVNLGWHVEVTPGKTLQWLATRDPWLCAFGVGGLLLGALAAWRGRRTHPLRLFLTCSTFSLVAGLFAIPAPYPQYTLLFLPPLAVLAGAFVWRTLVWAASFPGRRRRRTTVAAWPLAIGTASAAAAATSLTIASPFFRHPLAYPALGTIALVAVAVLLRRRRLHAAAAVVLAGTAVYQAQQALWMSGLSNQEQLRAMRVVHAATEPADSVLDGFSGYGWFRPHAWFYFFVHPGVRAAIPAEATAGLRNLIARADDAPRVVIEDRHLLAVIPEVATLLEGRYQPVEAGGTVIWTRGRPTP